MIYKGKVLYLKKQKAKQTFANLPKFGCIHEGLFRLYTSYQQYAQKTAENRKIK